MAITDLEATFAVNPFGERIEVEIKPEAVQDVEVTIDKAVEKAMTNYNQFEIGNWNYKQLDSKLKVLTPNQIARVLSEILIPTNSYMDNDNRIMIYLSRLIQRSYNAGHNDFILNTKDLKIGELFYINGSQDNLIRATIFGNVKYIFGSYSEYCAFDIKGDTEGACGYESNQCIYNIVGNVGIECGANSKDCTFNITGNEEGLCGFRSENSTYNIHGDTGELLGDGSNGCTYNVSGKINKSVSDDIDKSTFKILSKRNYSLLVEKLPKGNLVQLVDGAGGIIAEMKK